MTPASIDGSKSLAHNRWLVFVLVTLSYLLIYAQRTGPGVISNQLQHEFRVSAAALGLVSSVQYLLYMILQIPVGVLADKLGPARLLVVGMSLDGIGTILFSEVHHFALVLVSRSIVGLGDALVWVNIVLILGQRFAASQFGVMLGLVGTGGNLGALLTTIPLASWIAVAGWRVPFGILGLVLLALGVTDFIVLIGLSRPRYRPRLIAPGGADTGLRLERVDVPKLLGVVVRSRISWVTFACHCGSMGAYIGFTSIWAVPYFMDTYGVSRVVASTFSFVAFIGAMVGGPITGSISDRLRARRAPYVVLQTVGLLCWFSFTAWRGHPPELWSYCVMFATGFVCGGSLLTFAVIRDQVPAERSGVASGFANTGGYVSAVLVPVLFGAVIDWMGAKHAGSTAALPHAYAIAFLIPALFSAIGLAGSLGIVEGRPANDAAVAKP